MPDTMTKLPPIPQGAKIQKRPLNRRQHPISSKSHIVYVSSGTPLMAAVSRVRKQLDGGVRKQGAARRNASLHSRVEALKKNDTGPAGGTTVTVMGTGKAVEKALSVASFFDQQSDCVVAVKTGTVGTVDDVILEEGEGEDESRIRKVSCLEVTVTLK